MIYLLNYRKVDRKKVQLRKMYTTKQMRNEFKV